MRQRRGEQQFLEWKIAKAHERMEQHKWRRALEVGAELNIAKLVRYSCSVPNDAETIANT